MALAVGAALVYFLLMRWNYNAMANGEELARSLGVKTSRVRFWGLLLSSLLTAVSVAFLGMIGFIGLIAPQIVKRVVGVRPPVPAPCLCPAGAAVLLLADTAARSVISPVVLPVGAVTSLFGGAPVLLSAVEGEKSEMRLEVRDLRYGYTPERQVGEGRVLRRPGGGVRGGAGDKRCGKDHHAQVHQPRHPPPGGGGAGGRAACPPAFRRDLGPADRLCAPGLRIRGQLGIRRGVVGAQALSPVGRDQAGPGNRAGDVLRRMDLEECAHREVNALSGGERQKVSIARALAQQAPVLLFDEPTSSLDLRNQLEVLDMTKQVVRQQGLAAVVILHDLNLALRFADRFLVMKEGGRVRFWGPGSGGPGDDLGRVRRPGPGAASERGGRWWSPNECCERSFFMRTMAKRAGVFCGGGPGDKSGRLRRPRGRAGAVRRRLPPGETPWR